MNRLELDIMSCRDWIIDRHMTEVEANRMGWGLEIQIKELKAEVERLRTALGYIHLNAKSNTPDSSYINLICEEALKGVDKPLDV